MDTPDVTQMQKLVGAAVGVTGAILTTLTAFGIALTMEQSGAILGLVVALGSAFVVADAVIRNGRARALANPEAVALLTKPGSPAVND